MDNSNQNIAGLLHESMFPDGIIRPSMLASSPSQATGDLYYVNSSGIFQKLPIGETNQLLAVVSGIPAWQGTGIWKSYTSTWTGCSVAPTNTIPYITIGNVCIMILDHNATSNSATFNFTLPVTCKQIDTGNAYIYQPIKIRDNSATPTAMGVLGIPYNDGTGTTAKIGKDLSTSDANAFGGFTNANNKSVHGVVIYPI